MLGKADHIAYVVRDLDSAAAGLGEALRLEATREFELPEFSLRGVFLGDGATRVEVFELLARELAEPRLGGLDVRLDHAGYEVESLEEAVEALCPLGVRFSGPDGIEVESPIELGGSRHLWTMPGAGPLGLGLQLIERPS